MRCQSCSFENPAAMKFCGQCGASLASACPGCGFENPPGFKFCGQCSAPLGIKDQGTARAAAAPAAYTPKHLAEKILTSRSAIEGERKQVTVLFADVKSSMDLSEEIDPEQWHRIMDRFFAILSEGVHRFEGTINQFTGDGIMALFGAPIAHEDHARRACYAVLRLQEELRGYTDELRLRHGLNFSVRMGLNSGEVVVGKIGDDLRMDYTAQGHTVGLAARMEQLAQAGKALLTESTAKLVTGYFLLRDLGATTIKGHSEPLHVFELEGIGRMRSRLEVSRASGFSKFVGRETELAALDAALERALGGSGQMVGVVADAGTGKSRLCYEFAQRCRARDIAVYEGAGVPYGKAVPWLPVLQILRSYFGITEQDTPRAARDKIAGRMVLLDRSLTDDVPLIFEFLGVPDPEHPVALTEPEARQRQLFEAIRRLSRARSSREPAVFLFEDLHWFDRASEAWVENLVEASPSNRTFLLFNFRPEYHAPWMQRSYYQQLPLLPLAPEATEQLLADLLGTDESLRRLGELIQRRAGGNPFFIEEIVQSLAETGALKGAKGAYQLATATEKIVVPPSVQDLLAARIDRLPEREKRVLQTASVIGEKFSESILRLVVDLRGEELPVALRKLMDGEFLYEEAVYPHAEYAFKHPLTQEVAYLSQLIERRARVHAAVARTIEELDSDKLDERAALLAYHWEQTGDALEAVRWHRRAAEWIGLNNPADALRHWSSSRDLMAKLPKTPQNSTVGAQIRAQMLNLLARMGDPEERAKVLFEEGEVLAARGADPSVHTLLLNSFGMVQGLSGAVPRALEVLREAARCADQTSDVGLRAATRYGVALLSWISGLLRECMAAVDEGLKLPQVDAGAGVSLIGRSPDLLFSATRGFALSLSGHISEGGNELDRVIERGQKELTPLWVAHFYHVFRCYISGESAAALDHGRRALDYGERTGSPNARICGLTAWALANVLNSEWQLALDASAEALSISGERRLRIFHSLLLALMARVRLGQGDREKALEVAEEAIAVGRQLGTRLWEIFAQLARVSALSTIGGADAEEKIEAALSEIADWIEMSGAKSFEPFLCLERANLARLGGDPETRQRELNEAHRLFVEIGAPIRAAEVAKELGR
jgi:class 3 adenylate cyclase